LAKLLLVSLDSVKEDDGNILLDVVGETTVSGNTSGREVFTEQLLTSSTVVTVRTGL
jgi:hypothetical protein